MRVPPDARHQRGCGGATWPRGATGGAVPLRSATTKRSSAGFVAFMLGTGVTLVLLIAILTLGVGSNPPAFATAPPSSGGAAAAPAGDDAAPPPASPPPPPPPGGAAAAPAGNDAAAPAGDNAINVVEKDFAIAMDKTTN